MIVRAEAYAPGRVELLGNHTDYNGGIVLGAAIDRGLTVTGRRREDGLIRISSARMGSMEIRRAELYPQTEHPWANYVLGVVSELDSLGLPLFVESLSDARLTTNRRGSLTRSFNSNSRFTTPQEGAWHEL